MAWVNGVELVAPENSLSGLQWDAFASAEAVWGAFLVDGRSDAVLGRDRSGLLCPPALLGRRVRGLLCGEPVIGRRVGERCIETAGHRTAHAGVGPCMTHYGRGDKWSVPVERPLNGQRWNARPAKKAFERALWSWVMAHAYAQARDTTPWQALLDEVKDLAGQVAWLNERLLEAEKVGGAAALRPSGDGWDWVQMRDARGDRLAKVSKMAIDAGVAQFMVEQVRAQGELLFKACTLAAKELSLPESDQLKLVTALARKLTELESAQEVGT